MNSRWKHSSLILLSGSLLCQTLCAQEAQSAETHSPRAMHGWLIELLDRDPAHAREVYEAAALDEGNSAEDQAIARARLAELDRLASPLRLPSSNLRQGAAGSPRGVHAASNRINLREEFSSVLGAAPGAERERKLTSLRNLICDPQLRHPIQPRPYLQGTLRQLREARSTTQARLNSKIAQAIAAGDRKTLRRLRGQWYRLRRPALPRERLDQINRRPLAVIAQRQLQGKTQAAQSMARILRHRHFRGEGDLSTAPLPAETDHRKLLTEARRRLAEFILDENLSAFELQVMELLAERLALLDDAGREAEATALLARIPYYGHRFLK